MKTFCRRTRSAPVPGMRKLLKELSCRLRELLPAVQRSQKALHEGEAPHIDLVSARVVEAEGCAPVVHDEEYVFEAQRLDCRLDVARMLGEAVLDVGFVDRPMPIRSSATQRPKPARCGMMFLHMYDEVGLPWEEENRRALALLDEAHA